MIKVIRRTNEWNEFFWYQKGTQILHRDNGPAAKYMNGDKEWYQHGKLHREDGPAREWADGSTSWWYQGKRILVDNQKDFKRYIKIMFLE